MNVSHAIVTACMVGLFALVALSQDWIKPAHDWLVKQINTKSPLAA